MRIAQQMGTDTDVLELAPLLALVNVAMADAGFAIWESFDKTEGIAQGRRMADYVFKHFLLPGHRR
jgi:hypothetical protein